MRSKARGRSGRYGEGEGQGGISERGGGMHASGANSSVRDCLYTPHASSQYSELVKR